MTGNNILLDTNVLIEFFKGRKHSLSTLGKNHELCIPVTVSGELYVGIFRSHNPSVDVLPIENFFKKCTLLSADNETARLYGSIKATLFQKGKPIPENDIWIAATALQHSLPLLTFDSHFQHVDGLTLISESDL